MYKLLSSKTLLKMAGGGCIPHITPLDPSLRDIRQLLPTEKEGIFPPKPPGNELLLFNTTKPPEIIASKALGLSVSQIKFLSHLGNFWCPNLRHICKFQTRYRKILKILEIFSVTMTGVA